MTGPRRRRAAVALAAAGAILVLAMLPTLLRELTNSMLFYPARGQDRTPAAVGLAYEDVWLTADDGTRTQAWWVPYGGPAPREAAVVSWHGNAGTMADRLEHTRLLHDLGVSVLTAEYRGYGDSEGRPSEEGLAADARAALAELRRRAEPRGERVVAHGRSLGGAVAIRAASDVPVDGLIVESTFTSLAEMAAATNLPLARRLVAYTFDSEVRMAGIEAPVLVVHGDRDELIPLSMGRRLHAAAGGVADLLVVPGGTHNDTWYRGGETYWRTLAAFLGPDPAP